MMRSKTIIGLRRAQRRGWIAVQLLASLLILSACGGGAETETQPNTGSNVSSTSYTGPAPRDSDVQAFRINLWDNIRSGERCGQCHTASGQSPRFARSDDVNLAYDEALPLVNTDNPALSRLVVKVGTGHGCWDSTSTACVDTMTRWIENWVGGSSGSGRQINLTAPSSLRDPGESKNFPSSPSGFAPVHALLEAHCAECHSSGAEFPQSPYFASSDINEAYEAAKTKINLDTPADSRLVLRLFPEQHNCWFNLGNPTCEGDAELMRAAIESFAGPIPTDEVDPRFVISKAMILEQDGIVASGGDRAEDNLVALWEFKEPPGTRIANDTSGIDPAIDLQLSGDTDFIGGWGLRIGDGKAQALTDDSRKLYDTITLTGEYAIEAWVAPANVTQEDAYIISYSGSNEVRNFTLGQTLYSYDFLNRSSNTDANGMPALSTADADEDLQATLQHVVVNFDPVNGRRIYVNGQFTEDADSNPGGSISSWRNNFAFVLGNETSNERQWQGVIRMVAIHNRVLTEEQIQQNFDVGVGQKFFLLFYLGDVLTDIPEPYLLFEVSQFDGYSYLFNQPRFISLDPNYSPAPVDIAGLRIGINGRLATVGQAFQNIDTTASGYVWDYSSDGHYLSDRGTIIAQEKGAAQDEFFLRFDRLGSEQNVYIEGPVIPPAAPPNGDPVPDYGLRTFEEINATMSMLTTVSTQDANVRNTYLRVQQQLPTVENMGGFLAAHQMAVAQMAIEYCNALVNDSAKRAAYWPGFDFNGNVTTAFADRNIALDPLVNRIVLPDAAPPNEGISTQPAITDMKDELNTLIDELINCRADPNSDTPRGTQYCSADRTEVVMKAACGAAIGNAAMLIQ
jgi:hypothetical protein